MSANDAKPGSILGASLLLAITVGVVLAFFGTSVGWPVWETIVVPLFVAAIAFTGNTLFARARRRS
ncbi:hypothetical protein P5G50_15880 [Leifsonia sp. F6_8S_P_1B]|uniref:Uncharacterized protein n=1 Tax=Leifsonia williamsii TaxID=3035919 RepID=A0ABT8KGN3_9MICO|nr:hypothetical protein [Leifsonia williamsii]MDN4615931.1 hypothetical protein [Leifsonia williamsii]